MSITEENIIQAKSLSAKARRCCEVICSLIEDGSIFTTEELTQKAKLSGFGQIALNSAKIYLTDTNKLIRFQTKTSTVAFWMSRETYLNQGLCNDPLWEQRLQFESRYSKLPCSSKSPKGGFVYFVQRLGDGICKIGLTANLQQRIQNIVLQCGSYVDVLCYVEFDNYNLAKSLESELHQFYHSQRLVGEWFRFQNEDIQQFQLTMQRRYSK